jgi:hypothetical protein
MDKNIKIFVFAFIMVCSLSLYAQGKDTLTGFYNFDWSTDITAIKQGLSTRGVKKVLQDDNSGYVILSTFGGKDATIAFFLNDGKMYQGAVVYDYINNMAISTYTTIKSQLISKYGTPDEENENYYSPYYKGDGYEEQAIRLNKALISSIWKFVDGNEITVFIAKDLTTILLYSNTKLSKEIENKQDEANLNDF